MNARGRTPRNLPPEPAESADPDQHAKWAQWTAVVAQRKKATFLDVLRSGESVARACRVAQIPRKTIYEWREKDLEFSMMWHQALAEALDIAEAEAFRRGVAKSDLLLMFWIKAHNPIYRDTQRLEHSGPDGGAMITDGTIHIIIETAPAPSPGQVHTEPSKV